MAQPSSVPSAKPKGGHRAKAKQSDGTQGELQQKLSKPQLLNPELLQHQEAQRAYAAGRPGDAETYYPTAAYGVGHFLKPDYKADTDMALKARLLKSGPSQGSNGITPWGLMTTTGEKELAWMKDKKAQEVYMQEMKLGSYLIDPKRPETQDRAFELYPEV